MKINDIYQKASLVQSTATEGPQKPEGRTDSAGALDARDGSGALVDLSSRSVEFSRVAEYMDHDAVERAQKVNEIGARVLNGTYDVDGSRVADKILREAILDLSKD